MGCGSSRSAALTTAGATATVTAQPATTQCGAEPGCTSVSVEEPAAPVFVKTWVGNAHDNLCFPEVDDPDFAIPALNSKAPFAICISGGGFRATTLGLGWLRALHTLGLLQQAKYLCTNSGSSWLGAALSFQQVSDVSEFLGPYLPPEQCSLDAVKELGDKRRSFPAAVADAAPLYSYFRGELGQMFRKDPDGSAARAWTRAMSGAFLEPFGLGNTDSSTVTITGTRGEVHRSVAERAGQAGRGTVYTQSNPDLPFPIIGQALLLPNDAALYYPFEWTPLYGGCPVPYGTTDPKLGGGWVETLGLNAQLLDKPKEEVKPGSSATITVRPMGPASLGEAIGISSAYNSLVWALGKTEKGKKLHKKLGFHTAHYFDQQTWNSSVLEQSDGGGTDLHAVYPALRRRVPNILLLSATATSVEDPNFAREMKDLPALFGCWPGNPKEKGLGTDALNKQRQVFRKEGFAELHAALLAKKKAGLPCVHVAEYDVLENREMGVRGGWRVRVMWVVNEAQSQWEAALPQETRDRLQHERSSLGVKLKEGLNPFDADTLREFPLVSTFAMDYTPELVGLMTNHAAYMLVKNKEAILEMLQQEAPAAAEAAAVAVAEEGEPAKGAEVLLGGGAVEVTAQAVV
ncbi:hypothetical protein Agub_g3972 [Astrephomene gubernaculifera]|uniref:PLA2c domain-containing protein n=1 Tax=Astrephomene gubernaculifera TaxID=47775 RepID=A0AAD3DK08_9CHLO|nr:hypothetical protein Agub_g3972 [Astrephomene gubernaculifera]